MFSSFFNQVFPIMEVPLVQFLEINIHFYFTLLFKEGLAAAAEPPPNPPPQQAPPPSKPAQQESSGSDFLGGLLSVANQVGQAINEKNQPEVKQPPPTLEKPQDAPKISQEDIALISQGLGALVNTIKEKTATKEVEEEQVTKVDSQGGKVQVSSVVETKTAPAQPEQAAPAAGGDFLSGLMNVAKEVGKAINEQQQPPQPPPPPPQQTSQLSQEDIARITQGLSSLVGKAFSKGGEEGAAKQDTQAGTVQQPSAGGASQPAGQQNAAAAILTLWENLKSQLSGKYSFAKHNDFITGLLSLAKEVGKKVTEPQGGQAAAQAPPPAASNQESAKISQEDIGKIMVALGPLVNTIKDKAFAKKDDAEGEVAKVDSQGGKVQLSSVPQESTTTAKPATEQAPAAGNFLIRFCIPGEE
ncbi:hypothetical protein Y032_0035g3112 [Ancylostoma ceylanicum]|uniref:Uncharacterized protein n=1 Tax=Ancylostoma ceylanicum TaxID=53326 RepID=A0A016UL06_9BILA|nr:hypothetical protein Y032_0035g3112 [Ancylostoma ceylanicum]